MPWVTINHKHVLIGEDGGHSGSHNPAVSTGNKTTDKAVKRRAFINKYGGTGGTLLSRGANATTVRRQSFIERHGATGGTVKSRS